jgi:hypothetical protein
VKEHGGCAELRGYRGTGRLAEQGREGPQGQRPMGCPPASTTKGMLKIYFLDIKISTIKQIKLEPGALDVALSRGPRAHGVPATKGVPGPLPSCIRL